LLFKNKMENHKKTEYSKITDQIFLGTNMCCNIHASKIYDLGIDADIDLEKERAEEAVPVDVYLWLPVEDETAPSMTQLKVGSRTLDELIKDKKKVYVHCKNGHGRAPTLVAAYFILQGKSVDEAIDIIKEKRPEIHLENSQKEILEKFKNLK